MVNIKDDNYYKRPHWIGLCFKYYKEFDRFYYYKDGEAGNGRPSPMILDSTDFIQCTKYGKALITKQTKIKGQQMNTNNTDNKNYIGGEYNIAEVTYDLTTEVSNNCYFKIDIDLKVAEDDLVVVDSIDGLGIVRILKIIPNTLENASIVKIAKAWVVDKIKLAKHKKKIEATERREYIIEQLEEKKKSMEAINIYKMLAEMDPEANKLVNELKSLG